MVRCQTIETNPRFLAVDLARQLLPGTFEYTLNSRLWPQSEALATRGHDCAVQSMRGNPSSGVLVAM
jgi:hypothetical protein